MIAIVNMRRFHPLTTRGIALSFLLAIVGLIYLVTMDNGLQPHEIHGGDLITHQYAQVQARPSNAPGYPLYTMGGWLWFHSLHQTSRLLGIDQPNPLPILSSYSTLWALLALVLLFLVVLHVLDESQFTRAKLTVAWLITAFYAVTYFFWFYATTTEQYSSAIAQTLAILFVYLRWRRGSPQGRTLYLLAFLSGLSLAHMLTVTFIVPPLVCVILWQHPKLLRSRRATLGSILAGLLPLVSYAYIWLRGASHPEWWGHGDWGSGREWFWSFVSTAQGRDELLRSFESGRPVLGNGFPSLVWQELSIPILVIGFVGLLLLEYRLRWLTIGTIIIYFVFCWFYRFGNWFQVVLPAYPLILLGAANALARTVRPIESLLDRLPVARTRLFRVRLADGLVTLTLCAAVVWRMALSLPDANSRYRPEDTALDRAAVLIDQPLPSQAGLFADVDDTLALDYLINIWRVRPDLSTVSSPQAATWIDRDRTILVTWNALATLRAEALHTRAIQMFALSADWIEVRPHAVKDPLPESNPQQIVTLVDRQITPEIALHKLAVAPIPPGYPVSHIPATGFDVTLEWRTSTSSWPAGLSISVRPTSNSAFVHGVDNTVIQQDRSQPIRYTLAPTPSTALMTHRDPYRLVLPEATANTVDGVTVVLYRQDNSAFVDVARVDVPIDPPQ